MLIKHAIGVLACLLFFLFAGQLWAADVAALVKGVNKDVRQAERLMFSGKNSEADALLQTVSTNLDQIRSTDASNKSLSGLQSKYERIRTQVDKKLGRTASQAASSSAVQAPVKPAVPKAATGSSSANNYKKQMQDRDMKKVVKDVNYELGRAQEELQPDGNFGVRRSAGEKADSALNFVARAEGHISKIKGKYADAGNDATLQKAQADIASVRDEIAQWKQLEQQREGKAAAATAVSAANREAAMAQYEKDAAQMLALHEKYHQPFEKIHGRSLVYEMKMAQIEQAIALVENAEKTIPEFSSELGRLADSYGTTSSAIYNNLHSKGFTLQHGEEIKMEQMLQAVENVSKSRAASALTLVDFAGSLIGAFSDQLNDTRIERMGQAKKFLLAGQRMDASNPQLQEMLANIDAQMEEVADRMTAQIDAATWKGNIADFSGPGSAKGLAADAKRYFENDRDWGQKPGVKILAVCVRGSWKVAETDMFGRVIQWRLPIHVAVTDDKLRPRNIARVYDLSIVAMQGSPNSAPKEPPFDGFWVGDSWMMRLDKF
jgi:hypothetical protein